MKKFLIIIILILIAIGFFKYKNIIIKKIYYPKTEVTNALINNYNIYGRSFNIEGVLNKEINKNIVKDISLVLHTKEKNIYFITKYEIKDNKLLFKTNDKLNDGIILDNINVGEYYLLLNITDTNNKNKYYSLKNNTKFNNLDYYTITKNNNNKYITIKPVTYTLKNKKQYHFKLNVMNKKLPKQYYDIVIDPGHGGADPGTVDRGIYEHKEALEVAMSLKNQLTELGLKVKLTREGNYNPGGSWKDPYYINGRVNIPGNIKAKYLFSIHLNNTPYKMKKGGIEIYAPTNIDYSLAKLMADNIVESAKTTYSPNGLYKVSSGVYNRNYTKEEIKDNKDESIAKGVKPNEITTSTTYHYIIREPGGLMMKAYVDGRNPKFHKNLYCYSNIGVESYLIELGFISNDYDFTNIKNNKLGYVNGIKNTLKTYLLDEL
jgi:N-acetylmuramoyl-L-alanine amidase